MLKYQLCTQDIIMDRLPWNFAERSYAPMCIHPLYWIDPMAFPLAFPQSKCQGLSSIIVNMLCKHFSVMAYNVMSITAKGAIFQLHYCPTKSAGFDKMWQTLYFILCSTRFYATVLSQLISWELMIIAPYYSIKFTHFGVYDFWCRNLAEFTGWYFWHPRNNI